MRVTNKMGAMLVINNLNKNVERMQKLQNQMSNGQIVSRPSDDPIICTRMVNLNAVTLQRDQYERNMADAKTWLETTDQALDSLNTALGRVRELALRAANDTDTDRNAIIQEIEQIKANMVQIANTSFAGRYIFAGAKTTEKPYDDDGYYTGNDNAMLSWEVSPGVTLSVNSTGDEVFNLSNGTAGTDPHKLFGIMDELLGFLGAGDSHSISNISLGELDDAIDNTLNVRSAVGAKVNRIEMAVNRSKDEMINYESLKAELNGIDMAKLLTDFALQENVYNAALGTAARIIQPTLIDFLR